MKTTTIHSSALSVVLAAAATLTWLGCTNNTGTTQAPPPAGQTKGAVDTIASDEIDDHTRARFLEDEWGIKIEFATLSAGGYMVDFRFRILDIGKAQPILDRRVKPYLVDQASGAKFAVPNPPKVGQLRSGGNIKDGKICFIYFANPGRYVQSGNKVTVVIGDFEARDIVVQ